MTAAPLLAIYAIAAFIIGFVCGFMAAIGLRAMFLRAERDIEAEKDGGP